MTESTIDIRKTFIDYFYNKDHKIIPSSSLIPTNDKTLLFTNAGMNQFKNIFLGLEEPSCNRATTVQYCVRVGGKHNDIENIGYSNFHHTFFEMLGNFSFGDYFKREAINFAWELLTSPNLFNLSKDKFLVTVNDIDDTSYNIWKNEIKISENKIIRISNSNVNMKNSDNFWQMAETGPCGPCTEIFYDIGEINNNCYDNKSLNYLMNRYIEIWNIVFIQYDRQDNGFLQSIPIPSVDTGMGLERISAVLQNVKSTYDIDLFKNIIKEIAYIIKINDLKNKSIRIIADHIRTCFFLIAFGVLPSNENRGYVLRRIIRRAARHGYHLGKHKPFLYKLVIPLINTMGPIIGQLKEKKSIVEKVIKNEEEKFIYILERGSYLLERELTKIKGNTLNGEIAFSLYDTYGFPIDLISEICRERNIKFDEISVKNLMEKQKTNSRANNYFYMNYHKNDIVKANYISKYYDYETCCNTKSCIIAIFVNGKSVEVLSKNNEGIVILDMTPFYHESSGQIGDKGILIGTNFKFFVSNTKKYGKSICHIGHVIDGTLKISENVKAIIDKENRKKICMYHSATHLLYAALRKVLGNHVFQHGSLITNNYLRFDFSHFKAMTLEEINLIEDIVNDKIKCNLKIETKIINFYAAKAAGIMMSSNAKYEDNVRVLNIGDFSVELCGGTHVNQTCDIGLFIITSEKSIASGIRRIEALVNKQAINFIRKKIDQLNKISKLINSNVTNITEKLVDLLSSNKKLENEIKELKNQKIIQYSKSLYDQIININGVKTIIHYLDNFETKMLRNIVEHLKNKLISGIIILANYENGKINIIVCVTKDLINKIKANELMQMIAQKINIACGGSYDIAQGGGTVVDISSLFLAFKNIKQWLHNKLIMDK